MTKLNELIQQLCPDGVEYKKVKDVFRRLRGTPITAGKMKEIADENGEIMVFAGGRTIISAREADIPKANITRVPAVLVQSRGVIASPSATASREASMSGFRRMRRIRDKQ